MAQKAGSAEIQVHPNFRQFHEKLKRGVDQEQKKDENFDLPVDADLDKFKERMKEVERIRKSEERNPIQIAIELKTADAIRELRTFRALADDMSDIDTKIHVDRSDLEGAGEEFMNLETIFGGGLKTHVDVDRTELDTLNKDLQKTRVVSKAKPIQQKVIVTQETLRSPSLEAGVKAGLMLGSFTALGVGAAGATPAIAAFGSALASTTGTLFVLPAMVSAAGASFGALAMAVSGVGEAMSGLAGKAKEGIVSLEDFDEATKDLSASAKEFNRTLFMTKGGADSLYDGFQKIKLATQESMFREVNKGLEVMDDRMRSVNENGVKGMAVLGRHLAGLSSDMGSVAENWAKFRFSDQGWADLNLQLLNIRGAMTHIVGAADRWNVAWNNISTVGSAYLPSFTRWIRSGADAFAEWTIEARRTGEMVRLIDNGIRSAKNIGLATAGIFRIMGDVFEAAGVNAGNMATQLKEGTQAVENFTSSTSGQASMIKFFGEAQQVGSELSKTLMEIGRVIAVHVTPLVSEFVLGFGPKFRESIGGSTGLLQALEGSMFKLGEAFGNFFIGMNTFGEFMAPIVESTLPLLADGFKSIAAAIGALAGPTTTLMIMKMTMDGLKPFLANFGLLFAGPNGLTRKFFVFGTAASVLVGVFDDILGMVISLNDALGGMPAKIAGFALLLNKIPDSFKIWERVRPADKIQAIGAESTKATGAISGFNKGTQGSYRGVALLTQNLNSGKTAFRNYTAEMRAAYRNQMTSVHDLRALAASPIAPNLKVAAAQRADIAQFKAYKVAMVTGMKQIGSSAANAGRGIAAAFGGPWVLGISAVIGVIAGVRGEMKKYEEHLKAVDQYSTMASNSSKDMFNSMVEGASDLDAATESLDNMRSKLQDVADSGPGGFKRFTQYAHLLDWDAEGEFTEQRDTADNAKRAIEAIDKLGISNDELARKVSGSKTEWNLFQKDLRHVEGGEHAIDELRKQRAAYEDARKQAELLGPAGMEAARIFSEIADKGSESADAVNGVNEAMLLLNGTLTPTTDATGELTKALDMVTQRTADFEGAMVDADGKLDMTNGSSVALSEELMSLGDKMRKAVTNGEDANDVWTRSSDELEEMRVAAGLLPEQWDKVLESYRMTPDLIETTVVLADHQALAKLEGVREKMSNLEEGETLVNIGVVDREAETMLENMGFSLKNNMNGELIVDLAGSTQHAKDLLNFMLDDLGSISEKEWNAIITAPGGQQVYELINAISGKKIDKKNVTVEDVGGQEMADLLQRIGLIKIKGKNVTVQDIGGQFVLDLLRQVNSESVDKRRQITTEYVEKYRYEPGSPAQNAINDATRRAMPNGYGFKDGGLYPGYADGDRHRGYRLPTRGPGTETTDGFMAQDGSGVPVARLDAGEWIINGEMSEKYNRELMMINSGTFPKLPGYAAGRGIGAAIGAGKDVLTNLLSQASGAQGTIGDVFAPVATAWDQTQATLTEAWASFASMAQTSWEGVEQGILGPWTNTNTSLTTKWTQTSAFLNASWLTFQSQTNAIWTAAQATITSQWGIAGNNVMNTVNSLMHPAFSGVQNALNVTRGAFQSAVAQINPVWSNMGAHIQNVVTGTIQPNFQAVQRGLTTLEGWFGTTVMNVGTAWKRIEPATGRPAKFVVQDVFNGGIRVAWNSIAKLIEEKEISPVGLGNLGGYATGGVLPGYTPGKDVHRFRSATGGTLDLSGGEAIMRPEWTRAVGGPKAVAQMNMAARTGKVTKHQQDMEKIRQSHAHALGGVMQFASGGVVPAMENVIGKKYPMLVPVFSGYRPSADNHGRGLAGDFSNGTANTPAMNGLARDIAKTYPNSMELIYESPGFNKQIKNGSFVGGGGGSWGFYAGAGNHANHVHWAMNTPPTMPFGGGVFLGGSEGGGGVSMGDMLKGDWDDAIGKIPKFTGGKGAFGAAAPKLQDRMVENAWKAIEKKAEKFGVGPGAPAGAGAERWRPTVRRAMTFQGEAKNEGRVSQLVRQIQNESGGNEKAIQQIVDMNGTGINAGGGLLQFIPSTWASFRDPRLPDDRFNGWANINAGVRYARDKHGWGPIVGSPGGWKDGGVLPSITSLPGFGQVFDRGGVATGTGNMRKDVLEPERVLSPNQTRAFNDFVYKFLPTLIADFRRRPFSIQEGVDRVVRELRGLPAKQAGYREKTIAAMTNSLAGKFSDRIAGKPRMNRLDSNYDMGWFNRNGGKLQANISQAISKGSLAASDPWGYLAAEEAAKERIEKEKEESRKKAQEEAQKAKQEAETKRQEARQAERDKLTKDAGDNEDAVKALEKKFDKEDKALQAKQAKEDEVQQAKEQAESERIQKLKDSGEYYYGYKVFANDGTNPNEYKRSEQEKMGWSAGTQLADAFGFQGADKLSQRIGMIQSLGSAVQTAVPAWIAAANGDTTGYAHNVAVGTSLALDDARKGANDLAPSLLAAGLEMGLSTASLQTSPLVGTINSGMTEAELLATLERHEQKAARKRGGTPRRL